jgi:PAS domain S-box-containing protein
MNLHFLQLRSVKTRVTLFTLAIFVASIWALSFYTNRILHDDLQRQSGEQQISAVTLLAGDIDRDLRDRMHALALVAKTISPELLANHKALQRHLEAFPVFQSQFNGGSTVLSLDGIVVAEVPLSAKRIGLNYMDRSFVVAALQEGTASIGQPVMGKALKAPVIAMVSPIKNAKGKVIGALLGVTNLGMPNFLDKISANQYGKTGGYALVAPKQRVVVTATNKSLVMTPIAEPGKSPLVDRFVQGYEGTGVFVDALGVEMLASAKAVPVAGWYVTATLPTTEAFSTIATLQERVLYAAVALTLMAALLTWWVLGRQLAPLVQAAQVLNTHAKSIGVLHALPVQRDDEIGALIGGFNRVLQELGEREATVKDVTQRMALATDNAGIGIWDYDVLGGTLTWDAWMYRLYGMQPTNELGPYALWTKHLHPDDRAAAEQAIAHSVQTGERFVSSFRIVWADGSIHHLQAFGKVTTDASGRVSRIVGTNWDITDAKELEQSLLEARAKAELATRAKSEFLANMSHEIRTPMNAVLGMLKLMHSTELSTRQVDYMHKAEGAAKSLLGLLNDILDFSKIDAGKMQLEVQPFRLDHLMRDLSVVLSTSVGAKPVEVLFDIDPQIPKALLGDALRLQQVLLNLSSNAIKFTAHGEVVVQIQVQVQDGNNNALRFAVRDTGIGIVPEHQQHIFSGFSQAEASTTRRYGGTGLGLSISKRLVELMGGELRLDSVLGQGSTFYFTISLEVDPQGEAAEDAAQSQLGALDVLVVDDNPIALDLLVGMAQSWGWRVDAASGGAQAVEKVKARVQAGKPPYQAILMDWEMPGINGWDAIERIRKLTLGPQEPIIVMVTAHGREMLAQRSAQEQARLDAFLVKPVTASMLFDAVADARAGVHNVLALPRSADSGPGPLHGMRILVVEDNLINQQVAQELLSGEGAVVEVADNGQLGVAAVARAQPPFDAVLMDIQMPVMDGYTATQVIRRELELADMPIIAMTANAMKSDRDACLASGMNDHVGKPFDLAHLVDVLLRHTKRLASGAQANATRQTVPVAAKPNDLPAEDAVDIGGAIARMGGKTGMYARILRTYLAQLENAPDTLDALLSARNWPEAAALLHTIKGLSGTVGATYLAAVARMMEGPIKAGSDALDYAALCTLFRKAVGSTTARLGQVAHDYALPAESSDFAPLSAALNTQALVFDLQALLVLLENSDMAALAAHSLLRTHHPGAVGGEFSMLEDSVNALDFATALVHCGALIQKFNA